ncbi:membrane protein [Larkinella harenae]
MSTSRNGFYSVLLTALVLLGMAQSPARAQGLGNSPYSSLGIGEIYGNSNITNLGMGGLGTAYANGFFLNTANPALLVRNRYTIFEVGLLGQSKQIADSRGQNQQDFGANLSYLNLAFPVTRYWSAGIGLRPYSYVDYQTTQYQRVPGTIYESEYIYRGRGGLNKATFTNGFSLTKSLFVGVEAAFLFGNITNDSDSRLLIGGDDITVKRSTLVSHSDIVWRLGAAWRPKLNKDWFLNVGATIDPMTKIGSSSVDTYQQIDANGTQISNPDTVSTRTSGSMTLPTQFKGGIVLEKSQKLAVGVEFGYQPWSKFAGLNGQSGNLRDSYSIAAGLEYTPKVRSTRYLELIPYRLGFNYTKLPYSVGGKQPDDMSVSLGISLPVGQYVNSATISLVGGQRGTVADGQIRERYFKIGLGLSLNQLWFIRQKVD